MAQPQQRRAPSSHRHAVYAVLRRSDGSSSPSPRAPEAYRGRARALRLVGIDVRRSPAATSGLRSCASRPCRGPSPQHRSATGCSASGQDYVSALQTVTVARPAARPPAEHHRDRARGRGVLPSGRDPDRACRSHSQGSRHIPSMSPARDARESFHRHRNLADEKSLDRTFGFAHHLTATRCSR